MTDKTTVRRILCSICKKGHSGQKRKYLIINNDVERICASCYMKRRYRTDITFQISQRMIARGRLRQLKREAFTHYFGSDFKCEKCGNRDIRVLQFHHVNNDGGKHRLAIFGKNVCSGSGFLYWLKRNNFPKDVEFASLCANCHTILRQEESQKNLEKIASQPLLR